MRFFESILVIEINDKTIRAAVAQKTFKGVRLKEYTELKRTAPFPLLTDEELSSVLGRLPSAPKDVVVICGCTVLEVSMSRVKVKKLRRSGRLKDALKWELEEYMPGGAEQYMLGYEISRRKKKRRRRGRTAQGDATEEQIWVSVFDAEQFSELSGILSRQGKKLTRVYPPEACATQAALYGSKKKKLLVVDIEDNLTRFHLLQGRAIRALRSLPLGFEDLENEAHEANEAQAPDSKTQILEEYKNFCLTFAKADRAVFVCGSGAAKKSLISLLSGAFGQVAALAPPGCAPDRTDLCGVFGAAVREFDATGFKRAFGIDDSVPLTLRIKEKIHVLPIAVIGGIAVLFILHYGIMQWQIGALKKNVAALEASKATLEEQAEAYTQYQQQRSDLEKGILENTGKIAFLKYGVDERIEIVTDLLNSVSENTRDDLVTLRIDPEDMNGIFILQGMSSTLESINALVLGVQESAWCRDVRIQTIREVADKDAGDVLAFEIRVTRAGPAAPQGG